MTPHLLFLCDGQAFIAREALSQMAHQNQVGKGTVREPPTRKIIREDQTGRKKELGDQVHGFSRAIGKFKVSGMLREHQAAVAVPER